MPSPRRVFVFALVACWAVGACWAAASPPFSGPDETAHVLRAYGAGRGELIGEEAERRAEIIGEVTRVEVPRSLGDLSGAFACFAFRPEVPAGCATGVQPGSGDAEYETTAGSNPPLYHLIVAAPLELWPRLIGLYLARVVGAGVVAVLLAGAVAVCWRRALPGTLAGLFVACTPMVWFLAGVVNPSALELAGAFALWVGGVGVLHDWRRSDRAGGDALALVAAGGAGLALARGLGPLWVALVGLVLLALAAAGGTAGRILADRRAQLAAAIVGVAAVANTAWVLATGSLEGSARSLDLQANEAVSLTLGRQMSMWRSVFASFGYLDTKPPDGVGVVWIAGGAVLLLGAWAVARRVDRAVLLGVAALVVVVPVAIEASQLEQVGLVWQGRYTLPLLAGLPVLAGWALDRHRAALRDVLPRLLGPLVVVLTVAHGVAYWFALRRYAVGSKGKVWFFQEGTWLTWKLVPVALGGLVVIAGVGWAVRRAVAALAAQEGDLLGEDAGALLEA